MTRRRFVLGLLVAAPATARASDFGGGRPEERYFSVEAGVGTRGGDVVAEGYVINRYDQPATRVVLSLVPVDGGGGTLAPVTAYVHDVPPRHRTYFRVRLPAGARTVRAAVASFEWAPRGPSGA
jgi:hypothetical protein